MSERAQYRQLVADVAAKARAKLPALVNGRIEKAVTLVLAGDVEPPAADGSITVYSATDATRRYVLHGQACTCQDFERGQAPDGWCAHRIAAGIAKRVGELLPPAIESTHGVYPVCTQASTAPLPEAPASVNVRLTIGGREVQLTLRDSDEARLLVRLEEVLQRFPQPQTPAQHQAQGWCQIHSVAMTRNDKNGKQWWSHKTADGWCKGR